MGTVKMYRLLRKIEDGKGDVNDLTDLENTCSLLEGEKVYCHLLKGAILSVKNTIKHFRNEFETHINNRKCPLPGSPSHPAHPNIIIHPKHRTRKHY